MRPPSRFLAARRRATLTSASALHASPHHRAASQLWSPSSCPHTPHALSGLILSQAIGSGMSALPPLGVQQLSFQAPPTPTLSSSNLKVLLPAHALALAQDPLTPPVLTPVLLQPCRASVSVSTSALLPPRPNRVSSAISLAACLCLRNVCIASQQQFSQAQPHRHHSRLTPVYRGAALRWRNVLHSTLHALPLCS